MIRLIENKFFFKIQHINIILLFDNHIIITHSNNKFDLSKAFIIISTLFIIVIKITIFSHHLVKQIRNISTRKRMIFKMSPKKRFVVFILRIINDYLSLIVIFIDIINLFDINEKKNKKKKSFETFILIFHTH